VLWYVHERRGLAEVIHGGQRGVEQMASRWAFEQGLHRVEVRAEWSKYGNPRAILHRNSQMFDLHPHGVIAFPGDVNSRTVVQSVSGRREFTDGGAVGTRACRSGSGCRGALREIVAKLTFEANHP